MCSKININKELKRLVNFSWIIFIFWLVIFFVSCVIKILLLSISWEIRFEDVERKNIDKDLILKIKC